MLARAQALMQPLLELEPLSSATVWSYWWGLGTTGWTSSQAVSVNTPDYPGSSGIAHITYRSMDAAALLALDRKRPGSLTSATIENFRALTARGQLLPSVNEEFQRRGETVNLDARVAMRFVRSAAPWEIQSQVWALEQRAREATR
jgi:hypothetical protein